MHFQTSTGNSSGPTALPLTKFYADGIFRLPDSWTKVINNNGIYFTEKSLLKHFLSLYSKSKKMLRTF